MVKSPVRCAKSFELYFVGQQGLNRRGILFSHLSDTGWTPTPKWVRMWRSVHTHTHPRWYEKWITHITRLSGQSGMTPK